MSWEIVAGLLGLVVTQTKWKPAITTPPPTGRHNIQSFPLFELHSRFVDENYDEAGKLPLLSILLVEALETYERKGSKEFVIIPQARLPKTNEYKTDYAIALIEKVAADAVSYCLNCTLQHLTLVRSFSGEESTKVLGSV